MSMSKFFINLILLISLNNLGYADENMFEDYIIKSFFR